MARNQTVGADPALLVLDTSYTFEMIRDRQLESSVLYRDLRGFFRHVWSVHPFASLLTSASWAPVFGSPVVHSLNSSHTFIEGKVGRFSFFRRLPMLNFLIAQVQLFIILGRLIKRENISLIRAGDPIYLGLMGWALARLSGIPLVIRVPGHYDRIREVTGHPMFPRLFRSIRAEKAVERFILRRADLVAVLNEDNRQFAIANGASPERTTIIRLGSLIDDRHFQPTPDRRDAAAELGKLGLQRGKFLLAVGRLEAIKHPDDAIRVLSKVREHGHDVTLLLVGDGSMAAQLRQLARELAVDEYVVFAGNRDQGWLASVIPHAAVAIAPMTGRALAEIALGAAPVVAYDVEWHAEMIEEGVTGLLAPYRDVEQMAQAVERLLADEDFRKSAGNRLRERALDMLEPDRILEHERAEYGQLLRAPLRRKQQAISALDVTGSSLRQR